MLKSLLPTSVRRTLKSLLRQRATCPICGTNTRDWQPYGNDLPVLRERHVIGAGFRHVGCPTCGSSDRERLLYLYLKEELGVLGGRTDWEMLHVAPERNLTKALLGAGLKRYVCGDLFTEGYIRPDHAVHMDVMDIPFGEGSFDLVMCNHVLEHVPDDRKAMREILRVLKPGGRAILQVPIAKNAPATIEDPSVTDPKERERRFGQFDHVRLYGQDYAARLQECGFRVHRINISDKYRRYRVNPEEDLFVCERPAS
jgi:SAM-dependent methyltransferase